jgi:hypothetical protein
MYCTFLPYEPYNYSLHWHFSLSNKICPDFFLHAVTCNSSLIFLHIFVFRETQQACYWNERTIQNILGLMWFISIFEANNLSWPKAKMRQGTSPYHFYIVERAKGVGYFWDSPDTLAHWLSWNPLLCKLTKYKVQHVVACITGTSPVFTSVKMLKIYSTSTTSCNFLHLNLHWTWNL